MILFQQKSAKFEEGYREAIGRRKKNCGGQHENIGNKRKKLKDAVGFIKYRKYRSAVTPVKD